MLINGSQYSSLSYLPEEPGKTDAIRIIDQRFLPFQIKFCLLSTLKEVVYAIREMQVRGAPLIGVTAAFGLLFFLKEPVCKEKGANQRELDQLLSETAEKIISVRPTAYNTGYCVNEVLRAMQKHKSMQGKKKAGLDRALELLEEDKEICKKIGEHGLSLIESIYEKKGTVNILTHCNAGWLACVDYGTVTAPLYFARQEGLDIHVWVDETRPRNQGARLTVWELRQNGVRNTLVADNTGGHLMQKGLVDIVLVGCDRVTADGDVANKIGTYLKALAAKDNGIPFYVATPSTTIDWSIKEGLINIPIENRDASEIKYVEGWYKDSLKTVLITDREAEVFNPGFDVTPADYITGLITERGICQANRGSIKSLFPDKTSSVS